MVSSASSVVSASLAAGLAGLVLLSLSESAHGTLTLNPQTAGSCQPYPESGYCSNLGFGGVPVFIYDGVDFEVADAELEVEFSAVERAAQSIATPQCLSDFKAVICSTWYPVCDADDMPRRPCTTWCEEVYTGTCQSTFSVAAAAGMGNVLFECEGTVIGDAARLTAFTFAQYLDTWDGQDQFQPATYSDTVGGVTKEMACLDSSDLGLEVLCEPLDCKFPQVEQRYPLVADPLNIDVTFNNSEDMEYCAQNLANGDDLDCTRCFSYCELPCPYPIIYDDSAYAIMKLSVWLPGAVALPLNVIVLASEWKKLRAMKKSDITDRNPFYAATFSVAFFFIDTLPTLATDNLRCNGHGTFSIFVNVDGAPYCNWLGLFKVNILQALVFTVVCTLFKVRKQLLASKNMQKYRPTSSVKIANALLVFAVPASLGVLSLLRQADQLYEAHSVYRTSKGGPFLGEFLFITNNVRYMFTCGPKFATATEELLLVQGPLLVAGAMTVGLSLSLVNIVRKMGGGTSKNYKQGDNSDVSSTSDMGDIADKSSHKGKSNGSGSKVLYKLAIAMLRFAFVSTILVLVNVAATLVYMPKAKQFGTDLSNAETCMNSGLDLSGGSTSNGLDSIDSSQDGIENLLRVCGDIRSQAPSLSLLLLLNLANSLPTLGFGIIFAIPAIKTLSKNLHARVRPASHG